MSHRSSHVTVVIPTRNRLGYLKEAIASVEQQTFTNWRLVIVDDASEDDTWSWLQTRTDDRVRAVRLESHGERSAARNRGLDETQTPLLLFLDDDDRLAPRALEMLTTGLDANADSVAAVGGFEYFDDEGHRLVGACPRRGFKRRIWIDAVYGWFVHTGRVLARTEAVRTAGGFRRGLVVGEDRDLWLRVARLGPMVFVPHVVLEHRAHPDQWRPLGTRDIEVDITRRHLADLPSIDRAYGERAVTARADYERALDHWNNKRYRPALRAFLDMRRAPASLLFSPLVRGSWLPLFGRTVVAAVIGPRAVEVVLRTKATARRVTGREASRWDVPFPDEVTRDDG